MGNNFFRSFWFDCFYHKYNLEKYKYQCPPLGNMGMLALKLVGNNFNNLDKIEEVELSRVVKYFLQRVIKVSKSNE